MNDKITRLNFFYNLIEKNENNDFYVFPFLSSVTEHLIDFKIISKNGMMILSRDINDDYENMKNGKTQDVINKARLTTCLYFLCVYHLTKFYCSFIDTLLWNHSNDEEDKFAILKNEIDCIDQDFLSKLFTIKTKVLPFIKIAKNVLDNEIVKITDDNYAKLFDENKRKCIEKDKYFQESPIYVPANIPDSLEVHDL